MADGGVAVVGSVNADLVVSVARAPAAGETVGGSGFRVGPGGKGLNQAVAAARAGAAVYLAGLTGDDDHGRLVREFLRDEHVNLELLGRARDTPTGTAHIIVEGSGENRIVVVPGANAAVSAAQAVAAIRVARPQVLLLQLELPIETVVAAAQEAQASGARVILTPARVPDGPLPPELLAAVDTLVLNEHEARRISGADDLDDDEAGLLDTEAGLLDMVPQVVLTLGRRGARWASRDGGRLAVPGIETTAVDTTGAGDVFTGYLAVALVENADMRHALVVANEAAAVSVTRPGAAVSAPHRAELPGLQP